MTKSIYRTKKLVLAAVFAALAYLFNFFLHIDVPPLTFELKDSVITIAALYLGPVYSIAITFVVSVFEVFRSGTGPIGWLMDMIGTLSFALTASFIYTLKKSMKNAIISISAATVVGVVVMIIMDLLLMPVYLNCSVQMIINNLPLLLFLNSFKYILSGAVILLVYKPLTSTLKKVGIGIGTTKETKANKYTLVLAVVSLLIIAISIYILFNNDLTSAKFVVWS